MGKRQNPGELELTVMLALAGAERALASREVYEEIVALTGRDLAVASVHVTLNRLESKRLVDASMAPGPEGLGREVKCFALSRQGIATLQESRTYWERLWGAARLKAGRGE
jgi:DNA-binding PadR family transcriptional regulator